MCKFPHFFPRLEELFLIRNRLSVGHHNAINQILLATYRALAQLPTSHLHPELIIPPLSDPTSTNGYSTPLPAPSSPLARPQAVKHHFLPQTSLASPYASRPGSPTRTKLPAINVPLFQYVWLGLAGISTPADSKAFAALVSRDLCVSEARVKVTNGQLDFFCGVTRTDQQMSIYWRRLRLIYPEWIMW
jgi:hypothetical protein